MKRDIIELTETWGIAITLCSNAETVCDGRTVDPWQDEVTREAVGAGQDVVTDWTPGCEAADEDSFFANWHGGPHYRATYRHGGLVAAELYHREPEAQAEDDLVYGDWEWMAKKETPRVLQEAAESIVNRIGDAMAAALDVAEERIAEEDRAFAASQGAE